MLDIINCCGRYLVSGSCAYFENLMQLKLLRGAGKWEGCRARRWGEWARSRDLGKCGSKKTGMFYQTHPQLGQTYLGKHMVWPNVSESF